MEPSYSMQWGASADNISWQLCRHGRSKVNQSKAGLPASETTFVTSILGAFFSSGPSRPSKASLCKRPKQAPVKVCHSSRDFSPAVQTTCNSDTALYQVMWSASTSQQIRLCSQSSDDQM